MSKSRGNLVFVSRLRAAGVDPMAIRLALLAHHYRSDWEWTDATSPRAESRLPPGERRSPAPSRAGRSGWSHDVAPRSPTDLDTPAALAAVDAWAGRMRRRRGADLVTDPLDALLGILL